jgi:hypothetical protein
VPNSKSVRRFRSGLLLLALVLVLLVAYTGYQALQARDALQTVAARFEAIATDLTSGRAASAREHLTEAQRAAEDARANTRGPGWWLTARLPGVGDDVDAVRTVADVTDVLADRVLPDVITASEELHPKRLAPVDGRVDLRPIAAVAPEVVAADRAVQRQVERLREIDVDELTPALAEPVGEMRTELTEAAALSRKASYAVRLLPSMLGAEGERTYLVLFRNNAEVRATGGIPGSYALMRVRDGKVSLGRQGSAARLGELPTPALPLTRDEVTLFTRGGAEPPASARKGPPPGQPILAVRCSGGAY